MTERVLCLKAPRDAATEPCHLLVDHDGFHEHRATRSVSRRAQRTVEILAELALIWGTPVQPVAMVHHVDPEIFHGVDPDMVQVVRPVSSHPYDRPFAVATLRTADTKGMIIQLHCGHDDRCPLINQD